MEEPDEENRYLLGTKYRVSLIDPDNDWHTLVSGFRIRVRVVPTTHSMRRIQCDSCDPPRHSGRRHPECNGTLAAPNRVPYNESTLYGQTYKRELFANTWILQMPYSLADDGLLYMDLRCRS